MNLFADTDSDEEADDVDEDDVAFNSDHSSDDSGSEWSFGSDNESMMHDEDDEPLVYEESTGKFCHTCRFIFGYGCCSAGWRCGYVRIFNLENSQIKYIWDFCLIFVQRTMAPPAVDACGTL